MEFVAIDHLPDKFSRQELWELEYRRRPYMASWSDEKVRDHWDEVLLLSLLAFTKGSPVVVMKPAIHQNIQRFTHLLQETGRRGLPITYFHSTLERTHAAAKRLKLPDIVGPWIDMWNSRPQRNDPPCPEEYAIQPSAR